mmetsp:Transcript_18069/g.36776  ORF Transcript_18069/g.36776 Transcript_18069/m.36776 type:complete len:523 (+) Transcript_18069:96-1664(+)
MQAMAFLVAWFANAGAMPIVSRRLLRLRGGGLNADSYSAIEFAAEEMGEGFPETGRAARHVKTHLDSYKLLDFSPLLNTASYVNVVAEPEEEQVALSGLKVNIADQTIYPGSFKLHNDALNMLGDLWHVPKCASFDEYGCHAGACTVGSTEACLLSGLAFKFRWRKWYAARHGLSEDAVRREYPNLVISTMYQAAWEKLFKYMDIEPHFVFPRVGEMTVRPEDVRAAVDEKTIGVVCILGNHYSGHYDPVAKIGKVLEDLNRENGWQVGIHVDAASGGFIMPFQPEADVGLCDFRVPSVLSMSASGHKFGQSMCGTGWVVWRDRDDLSEHIAISVSYLGGSADSYTLNFSRPASGSAVQLFKFLRLGRDGYTALCESQMTIAACIRKGLREMVHVPTGKPLFTILDAGDKGCLPVVAAQFNQDLGLPYDSIDLQHVLSERHWYVGGYHMNFNHPLTEQKMPLFTDAGADVTMFRVVVKANLSPMLARDLLDAIRESCDFLERTGDAYQNLHAGAKSQPIRSH